MRRTWETRRDLRRRLRTGRWAQGQAKQRWQARGHKGQTLIIFALSLTMLLSLAGLSVDVARIYDLYARMQRAAEAGAAAGVLYLPTYYSAARTPGDGLSAVNRATVETVKNGFGSAIAVGLSDCPSPPTSVEVAVCQVSGRPNDLEVYITEQVELVLLSGLGVQPVRLTAKAQAEYMPPVQLGSRSNYFGDEVECSITNPPDPNNATACDVGAGGNHLQYFMATMNGPGELKEMGDPMVFCEEGQSHNPAMDGSSASYTDYNGYTTNNPVWSSSASAIQQRCGKPVIGSGSGAGGNPGNPDYQPDGYDGPATDPTVHKGGYNYAVVVPTNNASVWVFNPTYIPSNHNYFTNQPGSGLDLFFNQLVGAYPSMKDPFGGGIAAINGAGNYDAPPLYFKMTYSLYTVNSVFDRSSDTLLSSAAYPPYDAISADLSTHSCGAGRIYDPYYNGGNSTNAYHGTISAGSGCFTLASKTNGSAPSWESAAPAPCWLQWCKIASNLSQGVYRLVVEATGLSSNVAEYHSNTTDGWGTHYYALKVCATNSYADPIGAHCPTGAGVTNPGVSISAWNNMEINFTTSLSTATPDPTNPATSCVTSNTTSYTCLDLACIPAAYAGRMLSVGLYDPGDGDRGDIYIGVVAPSGSGTTITYPSWVTTKTTDGESVVHARFSSPANYNALNGLWLNATITLPPSYGGTCIPGTGGTGWFQIVYASSNGSSPIDWVHISFNLIGSPVHLVPPT
jgi:hypothetical protein